VFQLLPSILSSRNVQNSQRISRRNFSKKEEKDSSQKDVQKRVIKQKKIKQHFDPPDIKHLVSEKKGVKMNPSSYFKDYPHQDSDVKVEDYSSFFTETDALRFSLNNQRKSQEVTAQNYHNEMIRLNYQNQNYLNQNYLNINHNYQNSVQNTNVSPAVSYAEGWTGHLLPENLGGPLQKYRHMQFSKGHW